MSTADCRGRLDKAFKGITKDAEMTRRPIRDTSGRMGRFSLLSP
jgi:hypothetical protein